jgi:hypothetical protein
LLAVLTAAVTPALTALAAAFGSPLAQLGGDHSLQRAKPRHAPRASGGDEEGVVTKAARKAPAARKRVPAHVAEAEEAEEAEEVHAVPQHVTHSKAGAKAGAKGGSKARPKAGGGGAKKAAGGVGAQARKGSGSGAGGGKVSSSGGGGKSSSGGSRARPRAADAAVVKARTDADTRARAEPRAVSRALGDGGGSSSEAADAPPAGTPFFTLAAPPMADTVDASRSTRAGFDPRRVETLSLDKPRAFLFHGFMTEEECDHLVSISTAGLSKSGVVDAETGGSLISDIRTSSGAFVGRGQDGVVARIEARIAAWSQIPEDHGEAIQVLRYEKSQEYRAHYDYFFHKQGEANNRIATVLLYLSDVDEGGETVFPNTAAPAGRTGQWSECAQQGVAVKPVKGNALLFWSMKVGGELDGACARARRGGAFACDACAAALAAALTCVRARCLSRSLQAAAATRAAPSSAASSGPPPSGTRPRPAARALHSLTCTHTARLAWLTTRRLRCQDARGAGARVPVQPADLQGAAPHARAWLRGRQRALLDMGGAGGVQAQPGLHASHMPRRMRGVQRPALRGAAVALSGRTRRRWRQRGIERRCCACYTHSTKTTRPAAFCCVHACGRAGRAAAAQRAWDGAPSCADGTNIRRGARRPRAGEQG